MLMQTCFSSLIDRDYSRLHTGDRRSPTRGVRTTGDWAPTCTKQRPSCYS